MQAHHQSMVRSDSPGVDGHVQSHIHPQESMYNHQNGVYSSDSNMNIMPDYGSDLDARKFQQQHQHKFDSFSGGYRGSFGSFPNTNRIRPPVRSGLPSSNSYRDPPSFYTPTAPDVFQSHLTSPVQSHAPTFESRTGYDFGGGQGNMNSKPFNDLYNPTTGMMQTQPNGNKHQHQQSTPHGPFQASYSGGLHLSSQTPYGPHVPSGPPPPTGNGANSVGGPAAPPGLTSAPNMAGTTANSEEISTIFVVGFPEDMQVSTVVHVLLKTYGLTLTLKGT
jgi:hypothetical protein